MTVIDFNKAKEARKTDGEGAYLSGQARCLACRHEWVAVAPMGTTWLECPACTVERGRFIGQIEHEGLHWYCECGNNLFLATQDGCYCPNCGRWQDFN